MRQAGPFSQGYDYDAWGNITGRTGWGGWNPSYTATFNNKNQMTSVDGVGGRQFDAAGNMTYDGWQHFTYDAAGSQVQAPDHGFGVWQGHDGDGLRIKNIEAGATTYYLRSTVLGGQVVAELNPSGQWTRGYVYAGGQLVALQQYGEVNWAHQDPVNKSQRITNAAGAVIAGNELDPFGGATPRSWNNYRIDNGSGGYFHESFQGMTQKVRTQVLAFLFCALRFCLAGDDRVVRGRNLTVPAD